MKPIFKRFCLACWHGAATMLIVLALLVLLARLLLPLAGDYRHNLAELISEYIGVPVHVEALRLSWEGQGPRLQIDGLTLLDPESGRAQMRIQRGLIRLGFAQPLWTLQYRIRELSLVGVPLLLVRDADRGLRLAGFGQPLDGAGGERVAPTALAGLLEAGHLRLSDAVVELLETDGRRQRLSGLNVAIDNIGDRHRVALRLDLPGESASRLHLVADLRGPAGRLELWQGEVFLSLRRVALQEMQSLLAAQPLAGLQDATLDLLVWSRWQGLQPQDFELELKLDDLHLGQDGAGALTRVEGLFRGWRGSGGWEIDSHQLRLVDARGEDWETRRVRLQETRSAPAGGSNWLLTADVLELSRIAALAVALQTGAEVHPLRELRPRGRLHQPWIEFGQDGVVAAGADLQQLSVDRLGAAPAVEGLDAGLEWRGQRLRARVAAEAVRLDFGELFRAPIDLQALRGEVTLDYSTSGLEIRAPELEASADHLVSRNRLHLTVPWDGEAFIDLQSRFSEAPGAKRWRYLPAGIMYPPLVKWLDQAIVGGQVVDGRMLLHGPLGSFPFAGHEGVFDVELAVRDLGLRFRPDWPALEAVDGQIRFRGSSLGILAQQGRLLDGRIEQAEVRIEELARPVVEVQGRASGALETYLDFIRKSPLQSFLGPFFRTATASGEAPLDLSLRIPLFGEEHTTLQGRIRLDGQSLEVPEYDLDLADMRGSVTFTESTLSIEAARARLRGSPARIDVQTLEQDGRRLTRFHADGRFSARQLLPHAPFPLEEWFPGRSDWRISVDVPRLTPDAAMVVTINAQSDLRGTGLNLPAPVGKPEQVPRELAVRSRMRLGESQEISLAYGPDLRARVELRGDERKTWIERAWLNGGDRMPDLPPGGAVLTGEFDRVDFGEWLAFVTGIPGETVGAPLWHRLVDLDARFKRIDYGGAWLDDAGFTGRAMDDHLRIHAESRQMTGDIFWPFEWWDETVRAELNRLDLTHLLNADPALRAPAAADAAPEPATDPRLVPALDIEIGRLSWNDARVEGFEILTEKSEAGMRVRRLAFGDAALRMTGSGHWMIFDRPPHEQPTQRSYLQLSMQSEDLDAAFRAMGYADAFREGEGRLDATIGWEGAFFQPSLAKLRGQVVVDFEDGRLISVDPGMGRVFGLFSLQALPRRLSLDFKDFLTEGFSYDRINGGFRLRGGHAYTDDLTMSGPAATVSVSGRAGLVARDYDQRVEVRPHLVSSLPLVGAIAGGPATGLAVLLVEKLISGVGLKVEDIGKLTYTLGGSWDQPRIEKVVQKQEDISLPELNQR